MIKIAAFVSVALAAGGGAIAEPQPSTDAITIFRSLLPNTKPGLEAVRQFFARSRVHAPYGMGPVGCDRAVPACKLTAEMEADRIASEVGTKFGNLDVLSVAKDLDARLDARQRAAAMAILATPDRLVFARAFTVGLDHFERESAN